jgi:hypothetical protein
MKIIDSSEPEFGGPMTEDEVRNFLINSKKNVHISTLDEKGEPNIHPTWYNFENLGKLKTSEEIISYIIALMMILYRIKEFEERE